MTSRGLTLLPVDCFAPAAGQRGSVWLDSSLSRGEFGRRSYLATEPIGELIWRNGRGTITAFGRRHDCHYDEILRELESIRTSPDRTAIGFIGYEATLPALCLTAVRHADLPDAHFFVYDRLLTYDHDRGDFCEPDLAAAWMENQPETRPTRPGRPGPTEVRPSIARDDYLERVARIKHHIREGDIYQANFTCRCDCLAPLDPFAAYLRLRRLNPCWYGAYLNFGDYQVLSSSPERMFRWEGDRIVSSPIKGTIGLGSDPEATEHNVQRLLNSRKDRAELLMIVDLVRNDLGRLARTGSVRVDNLCRPEVHSSLIHLVADVSATPRAGCTLKDVVGALLPGGSVTGAPKRRAVQILQELETTPRSVYTGCIGRVGGGVADFNIAIRTMIHQNGLFRIHAGGGIVADSDPAAEYDEMRLKARNLFRAVGTDQ